MSDFQPARDVTRQSVLREDQNVYYDFEYVKDAYFALLTPILLDAYDADAEIHIADFGSGTGLFLDRMLGLYPGAIGYGIDISAELLDRNTENPRKRLIRASMLEFEPDHGFDILSLNWVLHHMVSDSAQTTRSLIRQTVAHAVECLQPDGRMVIFENIVQGLVSDDLSSKLLYLGTSSKRLAPLTKRLGANTAGVGIYYLGRDALLEMMTDHGLTLENEFAGSVQPYGRKNLPILARRVQEHAFVFRRQQPTS